MVLRENRRGRGGWTSRQKGVSDWRPPYGSRSRIPALSAQSLVPSGEGGLVGVGRPQFVLQDAKVAGDLLSEASLIAHFKHISAFALVSAIGFDPNFAVSAILNTAALLPQQIMNNNSYVGVPPVLVLCYMY